MQRFKHDRPRFYPDLDGEYVLYSEAQARIEEAEGFMKEALEDNTLMTYKIVGLNARVSTLEAALREAVGIIENLDHGCDDMLNSRHCSMCQFCGAANKLLESP